MQEIVYVTTPSRLPDFISRSISFVLSSREDSKFGRRPVQRRASQPPPRSGLYTSRHAFPPACFAFDFRRLPFTYPQNSANPKPPTVAEARAFIERANAELLKLTADASHAEWTAETDITDDTEDTDALINEAAPPACSNSWRRAIAGTT